MDAPTQTQPKPSPRNCPHSRLFKQQSQKRVPKHTYSLRNKKNCLKETPARTAVRHRFFTVQYATLWNRLPQHICSASNKFTFKAPRSRYLTPSNVRRLFCINCTDDDLYERGPGFCLRSWFGLLVVPPAFDEVFTIPTYSVLIVRQIAIEITCCWPKLFVQYVLNANLLLFCPSFDAIDEDPPGFSGIDRIPYLKSGSSFTDRAPQRQTIVGEETTTFKKQAKKLEVTSSARRSDILCDSNTVTPIILQDVCQQLHAMYSPKSCQEYYNMLTNGQVGNNKGHPEKFCAHIWCSLEFQGSETKVCVNSRL
ncbi:unnamed protein product [Calicophoron daubneyi]|uniref:Uncharacterized protein n=1 Tax=Calicophoron daubneyi TaxID=300641 RepID=A0AAV2SZS0_CALDB